MVLSMGCFALFLCSVPAKSLYSLHIVTRHVSVVECLVIEDKLIRIASFHPGSLITGVNCVIRISPVVSCMFDQQ